MKQTKPLVRCGEIPTMTENHNWKKKLTYSNKNFCKMGIKIFQNIIPPDKSENRKQERMELMLVRCSTFSQEKETKERKKRTY